MKVGVSLPGWVAPFLGADRVQKAERQQPDLGPVVISAAVALGIVGIVLATRGSFFTQDDHFFLALAREAHFGLHYLTEPAFDYFTPWLWLQDYVLVNLTHQGWWLAMVISLAWYAGTVAAFALLVRQLVGKQFVGVVACVLFAASPFFVRATQWWTLGVQVFPELFFMLLSTWAALRGTRDRRRRWLWIALAAYALALVAFIRALLLPAFVFLVLYLRPAGRHGLKDIPRLVWRRDRALWLGILILSLIYLKIISGHRYYQIIRHEHAASVHVWLTYLRIAWTKGVVPLLFDGTAAGSRIIAIGFNAALVLVIVFTAVRQRRVLAAWVGAVAIALVSLVAAGAARLSTYGAAGVGLDTRYQMEAAMALLLVTAMALSATVPSLRRARPGRAALLGAAALVAVCVAFAARSDHRLQQSWNGPQNRAYFARFNQTLAGLAATGIHPSILDTRAPDYVAWPLLGGSNLLSEVLAEQNPAARVGWPSAVPAIVDDLGRVRPVRLLNEVSGSVEHLGRRGRLSPVPASTPTVCVGGGGLPELALRVDAGASQLPQTVELGLAQSPTTSFVLAVADAGAASRPAAPGSPAPQPQRTVFRIPAHADGWRVVVGSGPLHVLTFRTARGTRVCLRSLRVAAALPIR